jgi:4-aminobutyrate aminotransferase-like enzyme
VLDPRTLANVARIEQSAISNLTPLIDEIEQVGDVRAAGAFIGIEFVTDKESIKPAPAFHRAVHQAALLPRCI